MIFSLLTAMVGYCLLVGRVSHTPLLVGCACFFVISTVLRHVLPHSHDNWTSMDYHAQQSSMSNLPAGLKLLVVLGSMVIVLVARSMALSLIVMVLMAFLTIVVGKTPFTTFFRLLTTPSAFLLLGGLPLLVSYTKQPGGVLSCPLFGGFLTITEASQESTIVLLLGALACVCCLYTLCLSTPLYSQISAYRKLHAPELLIELMYLIYRYIFLLSGCLTQMKTAATSRMGFSNYKASFRTTAAIMSGLLLTALRKSTQSFDAMESRCYTGKIAFLEPEVTYPIGAIFGAISILCGLILAAFLL